MIDKQALLDTLRKELKSVEAFFADHRHLADYYNGKIAGLAHAIYVVETMIASTERA